MFSMNNINMDHQRPHLLPATLSNVALLLILSQSQSVAWLSVKEFEDLKFFLSVPRSNRFVVVDGNI